MKKIPIILLSAALFAACEKQIDIDIEDQEPKVVVMAQNEADNPLSVKLTYSRPTFSTFYVYNGEDYFKKITNATVTLTVNGGASEQATHNDGTYTFAHIPQAGEELSLSINVPGEEPVTATATVPQRPNISNFDTSFANQGYDYYTILQASVSFTLNDPAATEDFYSVRLRETDTVIYISRDDNGNIISQDTAVDSYYRFFECTDYLLVNNTSIDIEDPTVARTYSGTEMLFSDATINGMSHNMKLVGQYNRYWEEKASDTTIVRYGLTLEVKSLTRDLYLYRQTMNSYDNDELLNFFSEPVQIHSNIDGGIGIFGVSSKTSVHISLHQDK